MPHVWVIEIKVGNCWEPCSCAWIARKDAIRERDSYWKYNNPCNKFRVRKYVRQGE